MQWRVSEDSVGFFPSFFRNTRVSVCAFATGAKAKLDLGKQAVKVAEEVVSIG